MPRFFLGLLAVRIPLGHIDWIGNTEIHTLLETVATLLAFVIGSMALMEISVSLTVSPIRIASGEITGAATIARDINARKIAETELAHQAQHDHLTGLPNTLLLADRLASSILRAGCSGLMTSTWTDSNSSTTPWGTKPATPY
jgi:hypothetical protein